MKNNKAYFLWWNFSFSSPNFIDDKKYSGKIYSKNKNVLENNIKKKKPKEVIIPKSW